MTIYGFDVSPFLAGPCDAAALRKLVYSERLSRAILAIDTGPNLLSWYGVCVQMLRRVDGYRELTIPGNYRAEIDDCVSALANMNGFPLGDFWLTFENTNILPTLVQIQDVVAYARDKLKSWVTGEIGIYTGSWYWVGYLGNPQIGFDVPLWDANYGQSPLSFDVDYGGWKRATIRQFVGDYQSYGLNVDLDAWDE